MKKRKNEMLVRLLLLGMDLDRKLTTAYALGQYDMVANLRYLMDANKKEIERLKEWNTKK